MSPDTLTRPPRELKGIKLLAYNIGTIGQILPTTLFSSYAYFYYTYVIGLDAMLSSIGVFLGLMMYAIGSPIFGVLSDNKLPTKFGKRKPFLLYGIPIVAFLIYFIWLPPTTCDLSNGMNWTVGIYFWVMAIGLNLGFVMIQSPYLAMITDQSETEKNRVEISTMQGLFNILGVVVGVVLPIILQSLLADPQNLRWETVSGQFLMKNVPIIGLIFAFVFTACILITYFAIDESFLTEKPVEKMTVNKMFKQMFFPMKHDNARWYLGIIAGFNMAMRILITVVLPLLTYVLILKDTMFIIFIIFLVPFALGGFFFWSKMIGVMGLQTAFKRSVLIITSILLMSIVLLTDIPQTMLYVGAIALIGIALACLVGGFLFPTPLLGNIIDEAGQIFGKGDPNAKSNLSGAYFGLNLFVVNLAQAFANMILGFIFTGGNETNRFYLVIALPIAGLVFIIAYYSITKIKIRKN